MSIRQDVYLHVAEFLHNVCEVDPATVTEQTRLDDVDFDSLELVSLAQELQRKYQVPLNDERLIGVQTVGELVDLVEERAAEARVAAAYAKEA